MYTECSRGHQERSTAAADAPPRRFVHAVFAGHKRAGAVRTLESVARIELASQGGALVERVTTTRTTKDGTATTTVRERLHRTGLAR